MILANWENTRKKNIVCIDSYENHELHGYYCNLQNEVEYFSSLSEFLIKMERKLDEMHGAAPATQIQPPPSAAFSGNAEDPALQKGKLATFELQILFRQHTSWQGLLRWCEKNVEHSFRSALEMILLMDSALRSLEP